MITMQQQGDYEGTVRLSSRVATLKLSSIYKQLASLKFCYGTLAALAFEERLVVNRLCMSATWPSSCACRVQILRDGFNSQLDPIIYILWLLTECKLTLLSPLP